VKTKITVYSECTYLLSIIILSFAVAMISATDLGLSMIVAPAYIVSQKLTFLTFGQCEYILQGVLFVVFCLLMKKVKTVYFSSFLTCIIYGAVLDLWRVVVPLFNPTVTAPGSMELWLRILLFVIGELLTAFSIALCYRTYLYPQVYDFFVKGVSERYPIDRSRLKTIFDVCCLLVACILTLLLFRKFVGIGIGTLIITAVNGVLIGMFGKLMDRYMTVKPLWPKLALVFEI